MAEKTPEITQPAPETEKPVEQAKKKSGKKTLEDFVSATQILNRDAGLGLVFKKYYADNRKKYGANFETAFKDFMGISEVKK